MAEEGPALIHHYGGNERIENGGLHDTTPEHHAIANHQNTTDITQDTSQPITVNQPTQGNNIILPVRTIFHPYVLFLQNR